VSYSPGARGIAGPRTGDGTFSRSDFAYDHAHNLYLCPGGKELRQYLRRFEVPRDGVDCEGLMR
jgi:hypothetical protein